MEVPLRSVFTSQPSRRTEADVREEELWKESLATSLTHPHKSAENLEIWALPQIWSNFRPSSRNGGDLPVTYGGLCSAGEGFFIWEWSDSPAPRPEGSAQMLLVIISFPHQSHFTATSPNFILGRPLVHERPQPQRHVDVLTAGSLPCL